MKWSLQQVHVTDLIAHPHNARVIQEHDYEHLKQSLDKFGIIDKPIINTDNVIIGGHQRLKVLLNNKVQFVECWVPDRELSQNEVDELNIRLNRNNGEWDWERLGNEWEASDLLQWGFTEDEIYDEKTKGKRQPKPSITLSFETQTDLTDFIGDDNVDIHQIKNATEHYNGKIKVKGLDDALTG